MLNTLPIVALPDIPKVGIVAELLTVSADTAALPVALKVDTIAVLPPDAPNVPLCGPLNELVAVYVAPVNTADALPMVAAFIVVPVKVPTTPSVPPIVS